MEPISNLESYKERYQKFTPHDIVIEMLDIASYTDNIKAKKVLENSFGSGNILVAIVKRYIKDCLDSNLTPHETAKMLSQNIYGVELDHELFDICLNRLDNLLEVYHLPPVEWKLFNEDALLWNTEVKFDFIIGNPPYICYKDIKKADRESLRSNFSTCAHGKFDYCYAFIEKGIEMLSSTGKLVQLVPVNIYKNVFANSLRDMLAPHIRIIKEYPEQQLFNGVLTTSTVFLYDKNYYSDSVVYFNASTQEEKIIQRKQLIGKWFFGDKLTAHTYRNRIRFGDLFHASAVVATLCNDVYVVTEDQCTKLSLEDAVVRPATSPRLKHSKKHMFIIFPYYYDINGKLIHYEEHQFAENFPHVCSYLQGHITALNSRDKDESAKWFEYGRSQALAHLNQEKLLISSVITNQLEVYQLDAQTIPFSGIFITARDSKNSLKFAKNILKSDQFIEYVHYLGVSVSGKSKRITCKDVNNFVFLEE